MRDQKIWQFIYDCLHKKISVILLIVVESEGSSPGKTGSKMAVTSHGVLVGTIGGGSIEHAFVTKAQKKLKSCDLVPVVQRKIHNGTASNSSGMACGGIQTIMLYPLKKEELVVIEEILKTLEHCKQGLLHISPSGMTYNATEYNKNKKNILQFTTQKKWSYAENVGLRNKVYIIGGGHIGLALSRILAMLDFYITIIDQRAEINTFQNNIYADEKKVITSFYEVEQHIYGIENYIIIMTPDHQADEAVLRQLVKKERKYIGLVGSSSKVSQILKHLQQDGITSEQLSNFHAPVGLSIHSHTPEEIAISIAAEMILIENGS
ncbi:MAG: XdhC/CoxI family protein [Candidatus Electrothrix sp. MAN1_4]|nr:XdhC/CoxI family protein [Candidatus Electrothrix sp. MAN1_4]